MHSFRYRFPYEIHNAYDFWNILILNSSDSFRSIDDSPYFELVDPEVWFLRERLIIIGFNIYARPSRHIVCYEQSEPSFRVATSESDGALVRILVLVPISLPSVYQRLVFVFKAEEDVLAVPEEPIGALPRFGAEPAEDPAL